MHFPQQVVAQGIEAAGFGELERVDYVAQGFAHLGFTHQPVPVHIQVLIRLHPSGFQHGGPEYGVGL